MPAFEIKIYLKVFNVKPIDHMELKRLLIATGMKTFVEVLYPALCHDRMVTVMELIRKYPKYAEYTPASQNTRLSKAKKIFNNGWQREALESIVASDRTTPETRQEARRLM